MNNNPSVLVGGDILFDLISADIGAGLGGTKTFGKRAGGSPFNIAVGIQRLGVPVSYVAKFGSDEFGDALLEFLKSESIDVSNAVREAGTKTTLAFVAVDKSGKPEFRFYRDHAADLLLRADELLRVDIKAFTNYHCGGIVLAEEPAASAYASLAKRFSDSDIPVSLDPTVRRSIIADADQYLKFLRDLVSLVNILKVSDEELEFLTSSKDFDMGIRSLPTRAGALVFVTMGRDGSAVYRDGERLATVPGFAVQAIETTGCGDSFMAALLAQLAGRTSYELSKVEAAELSSIMRFANAEAAIVATRIGAAEANPTRDEVEQFLAAHF
ncbi:MAG: carbohydrate kinase [Verrucomicrobia bacterium]|nr:carbohydrate kinase [Verrucomicrobiota bacterium]